MSDKALQLQAITRAVADAGLKPHDIDGFIPSSIGPGLTAEDFVDNMGTPDLRFSVTLHIGGASGIAGIQDAAMAVASGWRTTWSSFRGATARPCTGSRRRRRHGGSRRRTVSK